MEAVTMLLKWLWYNHMSDKGESILDCPITGLFAKGTSNVINDTNTELLEIGKVIP